MILFVALQPRDDIIVKHARRSSGFKVRVPRGPLRTMLTDFVPATHLNRELAACSDDVVPMEGSVAAVAQIASLGFREQLGDDRPREYLFERSHVVPPTHCVG